LWLNSEFGAAYKYLDSTQLNSIISDSKQMNVFLLRSCTCCCCRWLSVCDLFGMQGVTREDLVRAEEALQAANTDDTVSSDSRSENGSSVTSFDVTDVRTSSVSKLQFSACFLLGFLTFFSNRTVFILLRWSAVGACDLVMWSAIHESFTCFKGQMSALYDFY